MEDENTVIIFNALFLSSENIIIIIGACYYDYQNILLLSSEYIVIIIGMCCYDYQHQTATQLTSLIALYGEDNVIPLS